MKRCFQAILITAIALFTLAGCGSDEKKLAAHMEKGNAYILI